MIYLKTPHGRVLLVSLRMAAYGHYDYDYEPKRLTYKFIISSYVKSKRILLKVQMIQFSIFSEL